MRQEDVMNGKEVLGLCVVVILVTVLITALFSMGDFERQQKEIERLEGISNRLIRATKGVGKRIVNFSENGKIYILMINYAQDKKEAKSASIYFPREKLLVLPSEVIDDNVPLFKMDHGKADKVNEFYIGNNIVELNVP